MTARAATPAARRTDTWSVSRPSPTRTSSGDESVPPVGTLCTSPGLPVTPSDGQQRPQLAAVRLADVLAAGGQHGPLVVLEDADDDGVGPGLGGVGRTQLETRHRGRIATGSGRVVPLR